MSPLSLADLDDVLRHCRLRLAAEERQPVLRAAAEIAGRPLDLRPGSPTGEDGAALPTMMGRLAGLDPSDPLGAVVRWCDAPPLAEGPLSGRALSVKDSMAVAGTPMSCGLPMLGDFVPQSDSVVVHRLRRAGARIVAVTNMDALGMAGGGETSGYGCTRNPHDALLTAGGSSSGAAAGLVLPGIDAALGTDQGGSVRVPASWCGVLGLKPTFGLVPYAGNAGIEPSLDHVGPMARDVADLALVLDAITTRARCDRSRRSRFARSTARAPDRLDGVRVGLLRDAYGPRETGQGVPEVVATTAERLSALGAVPREIDVPEHGLVADPSGHLNCVGLSEMLDGRVTGPAGPAFSRALRRALVTRADELSPQVKAAWVAGVLLRERRSHVLRGVRAARRHLRAAYDRALSEVDVLVLPTTPGPAYAPPEDGASEGLLDRGWGMLVHTEPFNLSGHPALSLPVGMVQGPRCPVPVGVMLVGRHYEESRLLGVAAAYERAYGWTTPPTPGVHL